MHSIQCLGWLSKWVRMSGRWLLFCMWHRLAVWSCWKKMQEKMEVLAQRQGNSQINPLQPSEAGIKQKCTNRAKAVVNEPKNANPMGQGSQGSLGMHDESLPVREMVTGTQPVNTGMVNLAVQGNSGFRESETRGSNQMDMGSMGHDSQGSCEGHDEYRALRGMATACEHRHGKSGSTKQLRVQWFCKVKL